MKKTGVDMDSDPSVLETSERTPIHLAAAHLETALELGPGELSNYHIRSALQLLVAREEFERDRE